MSRDYYRVIRKSTVNVEPVCITDLKDHLRLEQDDETDDILLYQLVKESRHLAEDYANRYFVEQTVLVLFRRGDYMILPPDSTVTNVEVDGQTIDPSLYTHDDDFMQLILKDHHENVKVTITTGKAYSQANRAIILWAADLYESRSGDMIEENKAAISLLDNLRVGHGF